MRVFTVFGAIATAKIIGKSGIPKHHTILVIAQQNSFGGFQKKKTEQGARCE